MTTRHEFYEEVETYERPVERHAVFLDAYREHRARRGEAIDVLDVGCGEHAVLSEGIDAADRYWGADVKPSIAADLERYVQVDLEADELAEAVGGQRFDVVFCGEVIEHVFSPDRLLRQLATVLRPDGLLVLSTPNLAYWVNRVLLVLGISPLFVENSAEVNLGRRLKQLGQGNPTQGHIRMFTHRAMLDIVARERFRLVGVKSVPVWHLPGDRLACRSPYFAPNNVYLLQPPTA